MHGGTLRIRFGTWLGLLGAALLLLASASCAAPARGARTPPSPTVGAARPAPTPLYPQPPSDTPTAAAGGPVLRTVEFVNDEDGWAAGDGIILATTDGGQHWQRQYTGSDRIVGVSFVGPLVGWALGTNSLLRTTDGGDTWQLLGEPASPLRSVDFVTSTLGWGIVGGAELTKEAETQTATPFAGGQLVQSVDGGQTWTPEGSAGPVDSICFSDARFGWEASGTTIRRTGDGGHGWQPSFYAPLDPEVRWFPLVRCGDRDNAWVLFVGEIHAGNHRPYIAFHTRDGEIWDAAFSEGYFSVLYPGIDGHGPVLGTYPAPFDVIDDSAAVALGLCPPCGGVGTVSMASTADDGAIWSPASTPLPFPRDPQPLALSFPDRTHGWVVGGAPSAILATLDGGVTWRRQYP